VLACEEDPIVYKTICQVHSLSTPQPKEAAIKILADTFLDKEKAEKKEKIKD